MSFLNPLLLAGVATVAIPIIIHLLNKRKVEHVVWAAMRFLRVSIEQNERRLRIEDLLLLILRCVMVALLALALARPAIRSAVGAQQSDIRKLIFGEGFRLIAGGVLIGAALAILLSRVLRSFLFEVQPNDPATFLVVGALFVGGGLLACWMPVRRAARASRGRRRRPA